LDIGFRGQGNEDPVYGFVGMEMPEQPQFLVKVVYVVHLGRAFDLEEQVLTVGSDQVYLFLTATREDEALGIHDFLAQTDLVGPKIGALQGQAKGAGNDIFQFAPRTHLKATNHHFDPISKVAKLLAKDIKTSFHLFEALVYLFEALVYLLKSLVYLFKPLVYLLKPLVYLFEALVYLLKPLVYLFEALVYLLKMLVNPLKALLDSVEALEGFPAKAVKLGAQVAQLLHDGGDFFTPRKRVQERGVHPLLQVGAAG
jgi:hypothetical protein